MRYLDELAVSALKIPSIVLMENAGRNAAAVIDERYGQSAGQFVVFCGTGNNGGDGFVIARHLHNRGRRVQVWVVGDVGRLTPDAATNDAIVQAMGLPREAAGDAGEIERACRRLRAEDVVIDALLGTGFSGSVREPLAGAIGGLNAAAKRAVVAVDVPSGLDCDTGAVGNVAIRADMTVTFVSAKCGFARPEAGPFVGEVVVVDIGTPPSLVDAARSGAPA